ncbi:hypothetical protein Tco_0888299 [Tanacetum coccineum]
MESRPSKFVHFVCVLLTGACSRVTSPVPVLHSLGCAERCCRCDKFSASTGILSIPWALDGPAAYTLDPCLPDNAIVEGMVDPDLHKIHHAVSLEAMSYSIVRRFSSIDVHAVEVHDAAHLSQCLSLLVRVSPLGSLQWGVLSFPKTAHPSDCGSVVATAKTLVSSYECPELVFRFLPKLEVDGYPTLRLLPFGGAVEKLSSCPDQSFNIGPVVLA